MNEQETHTPTPWAQGTVDRRYVFGKNRELVAQVFSLERVTDNINANAAHIVKCVNNHDALVAALRDMVNIHEGGASFPALALAKEVLSGIEIANNSKIFHRPLDLRNRLC